ncbi:uncharacterized protein EI97DRAFT_452864 [Westerdykella ornata]|uniref:Rhodopsin domain-containing protein n=1 Tax=Westerdykella ornata TaxID=318751 RepID=A0A6A6J7T2_WESOR|nr:uncharacterized protein EI97DRAFT_452864 [Westerdykella ornata]KAF2272640.1 hypothetical protein EI97DRAFT_452864 [Westerdykella ornata]
MDTTTAPILLGVGGSLLFLSIVLLTARLWSRLRPIVRLHADDWTVLGATILATVSYTLLSASTYHGLGRQSRFVSLPRRRTALKLLFLSQLLWYWAITCVKLSVAFLLLRVKSPHRGWRLFLSSIIIFLVLAAVVQTCFQFLQCRPFSVFWDPRVFMQGPVTCFPTRVINGNIVAFSAIQVGVDLIFSFIPITFIRKLHRPRREKIFMCVLMALGLFASCAAIIRTLQLPGFYTTRDLFRSSVVTALWAVVELQFAIIAATMPTLKRVGEGVLARLGRYFYEEGCERVVRGRLVAFGLLEEEEGVDGGREGRGRKEVGRDVEKGRGKGKKEEEERVVGESVRSSVEETGSEKAVEEVLGRAKGWV